RCRLGIVDPTPKRLALARKAVAKGVPWRGRGNVWFSPSPLLADGGGLAFVFPGLEADFAPRIDDVVDHFGLPRPGAGGDDLCRHAAGVLGVGRLLDSALREMGITPDTVAGHSVGEWTAMITSGLLVSEAVDEELTAFDPEAFQVPGVEFATLGCGVDTVREAITDRPDLLVSHDNSPHQTVVCGPPDGVAELVTAFRKRNVISQVLPFRSGFHTPMFRPYLDPFLDLASRLVIGRPTVPVWSATMAAPYPTDSAAVRELYVRHLLEPVRFRTLVEQMYRAGVRAFVQVGPGQLGSVIDDTLREAEHLTVAANSAHRGGVDQLRLAATALWVEGAEPDFARVETATGPVRLDLGAPLVRIGTRLRTAPGATTGSQSTVDGLADLDTLAADSPIAAELAALLRETEETATLLISRAAALPCRLSTTLHVSTAAMPYLLDHCFAPQRDGWHDEVDRRPVVPATTLLRFMADAAEKAAPGRRAVAVCDVRLLRWLTGAPATDVSVDVVPEGPDQVRVTVGEHCAAVVELAVDYPAPPATPLAVDTAGETMPAVTAREFYDKRIMFHGPAFQCVTELTAVGVRHVRGVITVNETPGALLDNVGQLLGYWMHATQTTGRMAFPVRIGRVDFYGPEPAPGTDVRCLVRIVSVTETDFEADAQLVVDGVVLADIACWRDRRFAVHPDTEPAYRFPEHNGLATRQEGGWFAVFEHWPDLASRELYLNKYLSSAERIGYEQLPPHERRGWLLGRIAVKDAVRNLLWDNGSGAVFPAEIF
ncbi:MAG: polyketide synthase dehydratase domain-containing protein, partial [Kutzneria sp.]|nr:polyketide synthase dehydratase domain-containing protein [Kutzneria sp.]